MDTMGIPVPNSSKANELVLTQAHKGQRTIGELECYNCQWRLLCGHGSG